ncbi:MAG TPA: hypothetical protein VMS29_06100 [Pyrinomonadaceae bacterium]|jgi:hypothetical protein|nr:hypothetical protein [Pyrinomonadaceae bacterium]
MRKHNVHRVRKSAAASPVRPLPWRFVLLTAICACILAAGFFFAARQHFSTIDLGLKNSKLRKQIDDLESERRRLVLAKEVSGSPIQIARNARHDLREEPKDVPQEQEVARIEKKEASVGPVPVPVSLREAKTTTAPAVRPAEAKKVEKPKAKQAVEKSTTSPNERPRIAAENEKRVASATIKSF